MLRSALVTAGIIAATAALLLLLMVFDKGS
jgi:hypothetical protein